MLFELCSSICTLTLFCCLSYVPPSALFQSLEESLADGLDNRPEQLQWCCRRRQAKKNATAAKSGGAAYGAAASVSGPHSSSTSLPASSGGGAGSHAGRAGSGDAGALGQRSRSRGLPRSAGVPPPDGAADEDAAADAATLLSVSQPRPALPSHEQPPSASRLGSSRLSAFAQYSSEAAGSFAAGPPPPAAATASGDWRDDERQPGRGGSQVLRREGEQSREQQQITSSSESAARGVYETAKGRMDTEATSHSQEAGPPGSAGSGDLPAGPRSDEMTVAVPVLAGSAVGPAAIAHFLQSAAAMQEAMLAGGRDALPSDVPASQAAHTEGDRLLVTFHVLASCFHASILYCSHFEQRSKKLG